MVVDFEAHGKKVMSPSKLAHVVLRTADIPRMVDFYCKFLGAEVSYKNEFIAFMSYDEEHHRIALIGVPDTAPKNARTCGLEHIAFTFDSLSDLLLAYRQRKAVGIDPVWSINHGPTISIYYADVDGNMLETQVDSFSTAEEATAFMMSKEFSENPIGTDIDPEDLIRRLRSGEDEANIKKRVESGPRGPPEFLMDGVKAS